MAERQTDAEKHWPVYVVSLADAQERRLRITSQLEALGIPFQFIDAVDGRDGIADEFKTMIDRDGTLAQFGRNMTNAEYGCALSHMSIYKRVLDEGLPGAIVLEDDAIIGQDFKEFHQSRGYDVSDMIQLDHLHGDIWKFDTRQELIQGVWIARAARNASLTTGYSISRKGAGFIVHNGLPLRGPADWPCDVTALPSMLAFPRIANHPDVEGGDSTIQAERESLVLAKQKSNRNLRFLRASYWKRWWFKRRTRRIS